METDLQNTNVLSTKLASLTLKNPIVAGGGPLAGTVEHIKRCVDAGFGAVVTKTASTVWYLQHFPRPLYKLVGYKTDPSDHYYEPDDYFWLHREHNSSFTPMNFVKIIEQAAPYAHSKNCKLIGSYSARFTDEWTQIATAYEAAGCHALEINFCCPFPPEGLAKSPDDNRVGIYYTKHPEEGAKIVEAIKQLVKIPVFVKLSPDGSGFVEMAKLFENAGADGVTMFANNKMLRVDIETGLPEIYGPGPGTAGAFKAMAMRFAAEVKQECSKLAVMGGRGAITWQDGIEFLMAGSDAVQYCSPVMIRGLDYVKKLIEGMESYFARKSYKGVEDIKEIAMRKIYTNTQLAKDVKSLYAKVDPSRCVGCGRCKKSCWYDAISVAKCAGIVKKRCAGCSLCSQVCSAGAISMHERENEREHFEAMAMAHPDLVTEDYYSI
ncbi:4Fe-4S binding protein [Treponema primitia]|uniref:4Fe-4S dicluster-binding protein n=1 Tax=Treponema primitia TaxID=88058 RepID=UPI00397FEAEF